MSEPRFHAAYRCINGTCEHEWRGIAGPTKCPKCGWQFVAWLDFQEKWEQRGSGYMPKPEFYDELLVRNKKRAGCLGASRPSIDVFIDGRSQTAASMSYMHTVGCEQMQGAVQVEKPARRSASRIASSSIAI